MERESMEFDVVIVGGGPSGLSAAIRLRQLAAASGRELSVCVVEKGAELGAHILSGAVMEPRALDELLPDWQAKGAPLTVACADDNFIFLTERRAVGLMAPPQMNNHGNYIVSLGNVVRWLGVQAEEAGVEVFPGFAAAEVLYDPSGAVRGVATGDMGIGKDGKPTENHTPGVELLAKQTIFAEGVRGSLTKSLISRLHLDKDCNPQTYGIGIKELWEVDPSQHRPGRIEHTVGWPLDRETYGGSFLYHLDNNQVAVGYVVGLDYKNPYLSPFEEFQRFKTHPAVRRIFESGRRLSYGARALAEGGFQSIPRLTFPGGLLVGDTAGFLNVPKIKGIHTAMKSGMVAAEAIFAALEKPASGALEVTAYPAMLKASWVWKELYLSRNIRPSFHWGLWGGILYSALDTYLFRGRAPWTLKVHSDHDQLRDARDSVPIAYPKPDNTLTFDRLSSVFLSGAVHEENQPCHLQLKDPSIALTVNLARYDSPEQRYCPAAVYEIVTEAGDNSSHLHISASNCLHCKSCDIKDPTQNINWVVPEGGGGPNYPNM
ncbi:electron transfer flavoprotein-ubiquinone oxidoreductase [Telmatospirillum sp.]|uniref:electron transfer flavoprotein-ubiquinone oxidoreductase n=1 Tax=Telmatospirillum sp. TaxID=2079197 RepID=UPI00283F1205|nr:electron transfer flavoprotein-ubiquinone oxidoreductase [Telmatospirillum sp.]MDR3438166.1 electron transfer flavoprotein-ubiquinone oxidoreductase [Telmatospirillum sp.]